MKQGGRRPKLPSCAAKTAGSSVDRRFRRSLRVAERRRRFQFCIERFQIVRRLFLQLSAGGDFPNNNNSVVLQFGYEIHEQHIAIPQTLALRNSGSKKTAAPLGREVGPPKKHDNTDCVFRKEKRQKIRPRTSQRKSRRGRAVRGTAFPWLAARTPAEFRAGLRPTSSQACPGHRRRRRAMRRPSQDAKL